MSKTLFALRSERGSDGKSAFEKHLGRKPNTPKSRLTEKCILEKDPAIDSEPEDFSEADSTILVRERERVRGTKLESAFKRIRGQVVNQSENTITIVPKASKKEIIYSKRDVATGSSGQNVQKGQKERKEAKWSNIPSTSKQANKAEKPKLKRKIIENDDTETEDIGQTPAPKMYIAPTPVTNTENNEEEEEAILEHPTIKNDINSSVNNQEKQPIAQETEENEKLPITGTVKWEKARSSQ